MTSGTALRPTDVIYRDLAQKRVLITGGAAGIGYATAEAFSRQGCRIAVFDIDETGLERALKSLPGAIGKHGSVTDPDAVNAAFENMDEAFGGVDIVVNNAGISMNKPTLELSLQDWQKTLDINLTGVFLCCQAAARRMVPQGSGVILNISSIYGIVAAPNRLAYCATKSAVAMMTKGLAIEWAEHGIRVNALAPGYVKTALVEQLVESHRIDDRALAKRTPLGRLATAEEIADLAVFLASDKARYITGQVVGIDGGWTAYGYI
jgi:NAD(P)-dependent dehydrogenase (short-subunit alcohol dehydrogenase family)